MKFYNMLQIIGKRLYRNKQRTILTMLGIVIGITSVVTIIALGDMFKAKTISQLSKESDSTTILITFTANDNIAISKYFNHTDIEFIEETGFIDEVQSVDSSTGSNVTAIYNNKKLNLLVSGTNQTNYVSIYGRNLNDSMNQRVLVISKNILDDYSLRPEDCLNDYIFINGLSYKIIGIKENDSFEETCELPNIIYERYLKQETTDMLQVTTKITSDLENHMDYIIKHLNEVGSQAAYGEYSYIDTGVIASGVSSIISYITLFVAVVAGISLLIAGIGIMNMIYTSIAERKKEIGIKRALGATKVDIRNEFILEGVCISFVGGIIGFVCSIGVLLLISVLFDLEIVISIKIILVPIIISSIIGIFSSYIPARKASESNTIDILK